MILMLSNDAPLISKTELPAETLNSTKFLTTWMYPSNKREFLACSTAKITIRRS